MKAIIKLETNRVNEKKKVYTRRFVFSGYTNVSERRESCATGSSGISPAAGYKKKTLYNIILCTTTIRSYFPVVYKIAEEPNIHQEQSKARAGACLFGSLARRPDVPNRTRCLFRRASGQKKEEEEEPPSSNTQDNCLVLPDEEKKRWRGEREARVGPCENEWGHCQIRVRVIHHKHNTHTPALEVGVVGRRHFFVFVFFFFPCLPEKPFRIYKEGGGTIVPLQVFVGSPLFFVSVSPGSISAAPELRSCCFLGCVYQ